MKFRKLCLTVVPAIALTAAACGVFSACDKKENAAVERSGLRGSFTCSEEKNVIISNDVTKVGLEVPVKEGNVTLDYTYVYSSDAYPLNTLQEVSQCRFKANQTLSLKSNYTYNYTLELSLKLAGDSPQDLVKMEVSSTGAFEYVELSEDSTYIVKLSNPVSGTQKFYGANIADENNIFGWAQSKVANYTVDLARLAQNEGAEYDKFVPHAGVSLMLDKTTDPKAITNNELFSADVLSLFAPYCSFYSEKKPATNVPTPDAPETPDLPEEPDTPDNPNQPAEPVIPDDPTVSFKSQDALTPHEESHTSVSLTVGEEMALLIATPASVEVVKVGDTPIPYYETVASDHVFRYPVTVADFNKTLPIVAGADSFDFNIINYLAARTQAHATFDIVTEAERYLAANLINAAKAAGADVALTAEQEAMLFTGDTNFITSGKSEIDKNVWTDRTYESGAGVQHNDGWSEYYVNFYGVPDAVTINGYGAAVTVRFAVSYDMYKNLRATVLQNGKQLSCRLAGPFENKENPSSMNKDYTLTFEIPALAARNVEIRVYNNGALVSGVGRYSLANACTFVMEKSDAEEAQKAQARITRALLKANSWFINRNEITYNYNSAAQKYEFVIGSGNDEVHIYEGNEWNGWQPVVDKATRMFQYQLSATLSVSEAEESVTLNSASQAVYKQASLTVTVAQDSVIRGNYTVNSKYAALYADGSLTVQKGTAAGKKLTVYGGVYASGALTVDGVILEVIVQDARNFDAVTCGDLELKNGAKLLLKYVGGEINDVASEKYSQRNGITASGNILINNGCAVEIAGFGTGIALAAAGEQSLTVLGGTLSVIATNVAVNMAAPTDSSAVKQIVLGDENDQTVGEAVVYLRAATTPVHLCHKGKFTVRYCSLTVECELSSHAIDAHAGNEEVTFTIWSVSYFKNTSTPVGCWYVSDGNTAVAVHNDGEILLVGGGSQTGYGSGTYTGSGSWVNA